MAEKPVVPVWRGTAERPYNWVAKGISSQAAVLKQAHSSLLLGGSSQQRRCLTWSKRLRWSGWPMYCGEASSCCFRLPFCALSWRHLRLPCIFPCTFSITEAVHTLTAILAGGRFATDCMFMVLVEQRDALLAELQVFEFCLFVDGLTIQAVGDIDGVVEAMAQACDRCVELLEEELDLTVPRSKTVTVCSSKDTLGGYGKD